MLVLTRKVGESIQINDDVKITVIEVKGKNIRLGIDAPKTCLLYTSPSPRDATLSRMPSSA